MEMATAGAAGGNGGVLVEVVLLTDPELLEQQLLHQLHTTSAATTDAGGKWSFTSNPGGQGAFRALVIIHSLQVPVAVLVPCWYCWINQRMDPPHPGVAGGVGTTTSKQYSKIQAVAPVSRISWS